MSAPLDVFRLDDHGDILVNDRPLIEIVREEELPAATEEYERRKADPNVPSSSEILAGQYSTLPAEMMVLPSRNLLGEPKEFASAFKLKPDSPVLQKSPVLGCACGAWDCWILLARITVDDELVRWTDFEHFNRDWPYTLKYTFARSAYEAQLRPDNS